MQSTYTTLSTKVKAAHYKTNYTFPHTQAPHRNMTLQGEKLLSLQINTNRVQGVFRLFCFFKKEIHKKQEVLSNQGWQC